jgi:hypothetical protein
VLISEPSWFQRGKKATPSVTLRPVIGAPRVLVILVLRLHFGHAHNAGTSRPVAGWGHDHC